MRGTSSTSTTLFTAAVVGGLAVALFWPHEPTMATTADRNDNFAMVTVPVGQLAAGITDPIDGVFVLDFLTGQLRGAVLNRAAKPTAKFMALYERDIARDFKVPPEAQPHYAIVSGAAQFPAQGATTLAAGVIYIGELTSGKVIAYGFQWREIQRPPQGFASLVPLDAFEFRRPAQEDN